MADLGASQVRQVENLGNSPAGSSGATGMTQGGLGYPLGSRGNAYGASLDVSQRDEGSATSRVAKIYGVSSTTGTGTVDDTRGEYGNEKTTAGGVATTTTSAVVTYYKMVGYYVTGAVYESFVATGTPASSTTTNPNTGHTLINTYVAATYT